MNKMSDVCDVLNYNKNGLDVFYYEILEEMEYKLKFEYLEHLEGQWK